MTPLPRKPWLRRKRRNGWTPTTSALANRTRWSADRARRDAEAAERALELALIEIRNLPRRQGDMAGILQWTDAYDGRVRRWIIRIGDRADRRTLETPGGKPTGSHGLTWIFNTLRSKIVGRTPVEKSCQHGNKSHNVTMP